MTIFAAIALKSGKVAHFEFGTPVDPELSRNAYYERIVGDYRRRRDEIWDAPPHVASEVLLEVLNKTRSDSQRLANVVTALGELTWDEPATQLEPLLKHPERSVRLAAIQALGKMARFSSIKPMGNFLVGDDEDAKKLALIAFGKFAFPALNAAAFGAAKQDDKLIKLATEGTFRTRAQVAVDHRAFVKAVIETSEWQDLNGFIGFVVPALEHCVRSPAFSDEARARAAALLTIHKVRRIVPRVVKALKDKALSDEARLQLVVGAGRSRAAGAVPTLIELITDKDELLRHHAIVALGRIGDSRAMHPLLALWDEKGGALRDTLRVAIRRLGRSGNDELLAILETHAPVAATTAAFIDAEGRIERQLPVSLLEPALRDDKPEARRDAAQLLGVFGNVGHVRLLTGLANREQDESVKAIAVRATQRLLRRGNQPMVRFADWPAA